MADCTQIYIAPLEGITGYIFRNAFDKHFDRGVDKYFAPFIVPHEKKAMSQKEIHDLLPEHNASVKLVPQILTNSAEGFLALAEKIKEFGYEEINLNLGCPSGTVVAKKRGAGFLEDPKKLDRFFEEVFEKTTVKISVKTRIGMEETEEFYELLDVYNKYPLSELIIHPRLQKELYAYTPHVEQFLYAMEHSHHNLCYNGDINTVEDYQKICAAMDPAESKDRCCNVMIGRGILRNPFLLEEINGLERINGADGRMEGSSSEQSRRLRSFLSDIRTGYEETMSGETPVLHKLKEIWTYLQVSFPTKEKECKKLLKCKTLSEYKILENRVLIG